MADIDETPLPGIGTRKNFQLESGERIGVVTRRGSGAKELLLYDREDPDSCRATVRLTERDVQRLTDLLQPQRRATGG